MLPLFKAGQEWQQKHKNGEKVPPMRIVALSLLLKEVVARVQLGGGERMKHSGSTSRSASSTRSGTRPPRRWSRRRQQRAWQWRKRRSSSIRSESSASPIWSPSSAPKGVPSKSPGRRQSSVPHRDSHERPESKHLASETPAVGRLRDLECGGCATAAAKPATPRPGNGTAKGNRKHLSATGCVRPPVSVPSVSRLRFKNSGNTCYINSVMAATLWQAQLRPGSRIPDAWQKALAKTHWDAALFLRMYMFSWTQPNSHSSLSPS